LGRLLEREEYVGKQQKQRQQQQQQIPLVEQQEEPKQTQHRVLWLRRQEWQLPGLQQKQQVQMGWYWWAIHGVPS
jgi:hypothetical protein